ncbi:MAG: peptidylprolyl isomerase [Chloroflexota bacterium]
MSPSLLKHTLLIIFLTTLALSACGLNLAPATSTPTPSPTPTVTPVPLAVSINGEEITVPEFNAELDRYQQAQVALGNTVSLEDATQTVMDNLIDTILLAQGAAADGFTEDDAMLPNRISDLITQIGGPDALAAWESAHGYTEAEFRSELRREIAAAWKRDQLAVSIPATAEQVHVTQILLYNADTAQEALGYLKSGWNFEDLAARYDPLTKGELGWFPRGYLPEANIEEAAFALQPGEYNDIIQSPAGYHILYVIERDPDRILSPDARLTLQQHAIQAWLLQQRDDSKILFAP